MGLFKKNKYGLDSVAGITVNKTKVPCRYLVLFTIDTSGSLHGYENTIQNAIEVIKSLLDENDILRNQTDIKIYSYDDEVKMIKDWDDSFQKNYPITCYGGTDMYKAIIDGARSLNKKMLSNRDNGQSSHVLIFNITDGIVNRKKKLETEAKDWMDYMNSHCANSVAISVGEDTNIDELKKFYPQVVTIDDITKLKNIMETFVVKSIVYSQTYHQIIGNDGSENKVNITNDYGDTVAILTTNPFSATYNEMLDIMKKYK